MEEATYLVRPMALDDARRVAEVHVASWRAAYSRVVPDEVLAKLSVERRAEYFRREVQQKLIDTVVAECRGRIAGFASFGATRDDEASYPARTGEIWALYVAPDCWRRGVGSVLTRWVVDELRRRGFEFATLWVLERNVPARRFYERMGFGPDGVLKPITIGVPMIEMRYGMALGGKGGQG